MRRVCKALKAIHQKPLTEEQFLRQFKDPALLSTLSSKHRFIAQDISEDGGPVGPYKITEAGYNRLLTEEEKASDFWRHFFAQFITGYLAGFLSATTAALILWFIFGLK